MSFRKRSVRPNLLGTKRLSLASTKTENSNENDVSKKAPTETAKQENTLKTEDLNASLVTPNNDLPKNDPPQNKPNLNEKEPQVEEDCAVVKAACKTIKQDEKTSASPKRLQKRTKIMPKLKTGTRNAPKTESTLKVEFPAKSETASKGSKIVDTTNKTECSEIKETENNEVEVINSPDFTVSSTLPIFNIEKSERTYDMSSSVSNVESTECSKPTKEGSKSVKEAPTESSKSIKESKTLSNSSSEPINSEGSPEKANKNPILKKLLKRTKFAPKLDKKPKTTLSSDKIDLQTETNSPEPIKGIESSGLSKDDDFVEKKPEAVVTKISTTLEEQNKTKTTESPKKKLSKRTKIAPKVNRKTSSKAEPLSSKTPMPKDNNLPQSNKANLSESLNFNSSPPKIIISETNDAHISKSDETISDELPSKSNDSEIAYNNTISNEIDTNFVLSTTNEEIESNANNLSAQPNEDSPIELQCESNANNLFPEPQEVKKQVRFTQGAGDELTNNINEKSTTNEKPESDGESKHPLHSRKFQPNFAAPRKRRRLPSFSAYSSCDENADEGQNKNKTQTKKVPLTKEEAKKIDDVAIESERSLEVKSEDKKKIRRKRKQVHGAPSEKKERKETFSQERDLSGLTMQELIHYRPKSFQKAGLKTQNKSLEEGTVLETAIDLPTNDQKQQVKMAEEDDVMAPQIMLDENGEIVLNESSLTIKHKVDDSALRSSAIVYEDSMSVSSQRKRKSQKTWSLEETLRFYKALSQIGTDFTLMAQAFGRFTRNELKKKFKKEEKLNCDLVDRALLNRLPLDMETFIRGKRERKSLEEETILIETETDALSAENATGENEKLTELQMAEQLIGIKVP